MSHTHTREYCVVRQCTFLRVLYTGLLPCQGLWAHGWEQSESLLGHFVGVEHQYWYEVVVWSPIASSLQRPYLVPPCLCPADELHSEVFSLAACRDRIVPVSEPLWGSVFVSTKANRRAQVLAMTIDFPDLVILCGSVVNLRCSSTSYIHVHTYHGTRNLAYSGYGVCTCVHVCIQNVMLIFHHCMIVE